MASTTIIIPPISNIRKNINKNENTSGIMYLYLPGRDSNS